ncbi:PB1 domain-containing protein [Carex littledalei]|uniref:PB1 domain-containing protein n=1 Tax=Carex littledalei TaxID=544730 RepID=A0A833QLD9_9POAL|nr:PB1 domain-containing protein [Carex littledalei]
MDFSRAAHVALNTNQPCSTFFKPLLRQFTVIIPCSRPPLCNLVRSHSAAAAFLAGEVESFMATGHPHPHPHHHDTSVPAISTTSSTTSITPPSNPITTTTSNHSNHSTSHASIAAAPTNAQIPHVRLMCSYGGRILPRPGDHLLRYVGGETRIVSFPRNASFSTLVSLLSSLSPSHFTHKSPPIIKYQLPNEDLDSLISLCSDDDLINMLDELDRLNPASKSPRLRFFLFPSSQSGAFGSVLSTGESNQWFLDALNSASPTAVGSVLERRRSEASSSMVSDPPDYLTGIDTGSDRSPVNVDSDPTETIEPVEPVVPAPLQEAPVQPAQAPPVYYMPQPMPVYYMPAPVSYMQPSLEGQGNMPVRGYIPMPISRQVYYSKENEQFVEMGPSSFVYEQATGGAYVRAPLSYPPAAVYPPQADTDKKSPAVPGMDVRGLAS